MNITYNYEIIAVDEEAGVMEIVYTAEGHPTQHIGARLPAEGEVLEDVIKTYSPVNFWNELSAIRQSVSVGTSGIVEPVVIPELTYAELRAAEYPPMEDYLDAIVKGDEEQKQAYIDACLAVKAKYPKESN